MSTNPDRCYGCRKVIEGDYYARCSTCFTKGPANHSHSLFAKLEQLEQTIETQKSVIAHQHERIIEAEKVINYYAFWENHQTQTVFNKESRRDVYASAVYFCDESGKRAREYQKKYPQGSDPNQTEIVEADHQNTRV